MDEINHLTCNAYWTKHLLAIGLGGATGLISSIIITRIQRRRASRDAIIELVQEITAIAVVYWNSTGQRKDREEDLLRQLELLGTKTEARYSKTRLMVIRDSIDDLHHFVTGGLFGTVNRQPCQTTVQSIRRKTKNLLDQL